MCDNHSGGGSPRRAYCADEFSQLVIELPLDAAGHEHIHASSYDTYVAYAVDGTGAKVAFKAELRIGGEHTTGYALERVPVRRASLPFGHMHLSWAAQAGVKLVLILGEAEDIGIVV